MILIKRLKDRKNLSKAVVANVYSGFPSHSFINIGITGTDGKTTTASLIYQILTAAGKQAGLITTLGAKIGDKDYDTGFHVTTPTPWPLQKFLRQMKGAGVTHTVLETTSHGLDQHRVWGIPFAVGVLTNITHEHLDYHKTMEEYFEAKARLFEKVKFAVLNRDDSSLDTLSELTRSSRHPERSEGSLSLSKISHSRGILRRFTPQNDKKTEVVSYGLKEGDVQSKNISYSASGTSFEIVFPDNRALVDSASRSRFAPVILGRSEMTTPESGFWTSQNDWNAQKLGSKKLIKVKTKLLGDYNVSNCLAAAAAAWCLKISPEIIKKGLEEFEPLEGRFNIIDEGQKFTAVLDFAHTPNSLERVLKTAHQVTKGSVVVVFGCAGLRDYKKRPVMGRIASELADFTVITAEDPRTESLDKICQEIASGFHERSRETFRDRLDPDPGTEESGNDEAKKYLIIKDRREAIKTAFEKAKKGDLVLVTGKGHEKSMCFGKTEYPWSDREVMEKLLENC